MTEWLSKHLFKLTCSAVIAVMGYVGSTWESRLHERLNAVESSQRQLDRVETKLDDLISEVRRLEQRIDRRTPEKE